MARGRKPAITGMARPEGIIDDVVIPVARAATRGAFRSGNKVARAAGKVGANKTRRRILNSQMKVVKAESYLRGKQGDMYRDKVLKNLDKYMASPSPSRYVESSRGRRSFTKSEVAAAKLNRLKNPVAASKKNPQRYETVREAGRAAKKDAKKTIKELRRFK